MAFEDYASLGKRRRRRPGYALVASNGTIAFTPEDIERLGLTKGEAILCVDRAEKLIAIVKPVGLVPCVRVYQRARKNQPPFFEVCIKGALQMMELPAEKWRRCLLIRHEPGRMLISFADPPA